MNTRITIMVAGQDIDEQAMQNQLSQAVGGQVIKRGETRGSLSDAITYIADLVAPASKIADKLISITKNLIAGSSVKIKYRGQEIEVGNVPREQLITVLQMAINGASSDRG